MTTENNNTCGNAVKDEKKTPCETKIQMHEMMAIADVLDGDELLFSGLHQSGKRTKVSHQVARSLFANVGNTDGKQKGIEFAVLALFKLGEAKLCIPMAWISIQCLAHKSDICGVCVQKTVNHRKIAILRENAAQKNVILAKIFDGGGGVENFLADLGAPSCVEVRACSLKFCDQPRRTCPCRSGSGK